MAESSNPASRARHIVSKRRAAGFVLALGCCVSTTPCLSATAGAPGAKDLVVVKNGASDAIIVRSPDAGPYERQAADDLARYIDRMSGAKLPVVDTEDAIETALSSSRPVFVVGGLALRLKPELWSSLASVIKKYPMLRNDGVVLRHEGNRIYVAGSGDQSHYFAAAELLRRWGVRWFMPGEFGECVPQEKELKIGNLDYSFAPPFEIRAYNITWLGDVTGQEIFQKRNMMSGLAELPLAGHVLGAYTKGLGKNQANFPLTDPKTAVQIASKIEKLFSANKNISLSIEDQPFIADYEIDKPLAHLQWDKYFSMWSVTDPMLVMYNNVAQILHEKYPASTAKIGFLAYINMTLPPVQTITTDPSLFAQLAPIDIDPIHSMDDPRSPSKQEYRGILDAWAKVMNKRLTIYDYDQSMLVWRDLPNPSHIAFREDVKHYRNAGILGFNTEGRNALATTFLNIYMRARLMWNPDEDVDALLNDFYSKFFGPAALPMKEYWSAIFKAWQQTIVTEHEYFVAPAIYTPELLTRLGAYLQAAEAALKPLMSQGRVLSRNEQLYIQRLRFVRLGYTIMDSYMAMVRAAGTETDFIAAVEAGERGLQARDELSAMNPAFTTTRLESGYAFWPGEVKQYRELVPFMNGEKGVLIAKLPLQWSFHRDAQKDGMDKGFLNGPVDLSYWNANHKKYDVAAMKDYPADQWEMIRSDLYVQAQGVRFPDQKSFTGDLWYRTTVSLTGAQASEVLHLRFPGLFNNCELYINGQEIARRTQNDAWWLNDYRFEWDAPLQGKVREGDNAIALRCHNTNHMGGMFRRPFIYARR